MALAFRNFKSENHTRFNKLLVSWFRSSPHSDIDLLANFETKTTLGINTLLVSFRFRNSLKGDIEMLRISESGHTRSGRHAGEEESPWCASVPPSRKPNSHPSIW